MSCLRIFAFTKCDAMSRPYTRKMAPQHHVHTCTACDGAGLTQDVDYDEGGAVHCSVRCEACDGSGLTTSCDRCDEVMPVTEAELGGYICGPCRAGLERGDAAAEIARIRRAS